MSDQMFVLVLFCVLCIVTRIQPIDSESLNYDNFNVSQTNCTPAALEEFPSDGFTRTDRKNGWITVHVLITAYCFIVLSIVCDEYFVPGIQTLVTRLQISEDIAGASFMAITSASPELFINVVGTFITEGDIGVGTVVGSNVFNILAAPACCGLFAKMAFQFETWSITRDCAMYAISVVLLIVTLHDDTVYWYEALTFVVAYFVYIAMMYYDKSIHGKLAEWNGRRKQRCAKSDEETAQATEIESLTEANKITINGKTLDEDFKVNDNVKKTEECNKSEDDSIWNLVWKVITFPTNKALQYTVPNCRNNPKLYPFTLLMCMVWIGFISYLLAWVITAIGDTLGIPDSVMGLSFLAVGSSMPEIVTCVIVSKQGQGIMGMSSALGANTFEILLCLGLPWLIKTLFGDHSIHINSSGLAYSATCLLSTLIFLYICLVANRFRLDWKVGLICLIMYGLFLIVGTLIELNVFFVANLPTC